MSSLSLNSFKFGISRGSKMKYKPTVPHHLNDLDGLCVMSKLNGVHIFFIDGMYIMNSSAMESDMVFYSIVRNLSCFFDLPVQIFKQQ